jgi:uncharacterized protein DUF4301
MLDQADRAQLAELGISEEEVARQLRLFAQPPPAPVLDRPCTIGDGIIRLDGAAQHAAKLAYDRAVADDRVLKFVPASGAATRMCQALLAVRTTPGPLTRAALAQRAAAGDGDAREALIFADNVSRFAFAEALAARSTRRDDLRGLFAALLDAAGLDYAALPKGLVAFHRYPDGSRTAFEEHLVEAAALVRSLSQTARVHLTVSPEHEQAFRTLFERLRDRYEARYGVRFEVGFSHQKAATDTLAVDLDNRPLRKDGRLLFRPGGHGALIENLNDLRGDVIYIKNIDNIPPDHRRAEVVDCARMLIGHLVSVQAAVFRYRAALAGAGAADPECVAGARRLAAELFAADAASASDLAALFDRPLRVCGMVKNTGEPGGGPFWVREAEGGCTRQIVESAQVEQGRDDQRAIFAAATHFNPVVMACGVRNWRGQPFDLRDFVDPSAVFITTKSKDGRALKALERPGLWNGGMARWNTIFVEVTDATFTPVKALNDLLRPAHQAPTGGRAA